MSASLVGSEMCIRDRDRLHPDRAQLGGHQDKVPAGVPASTAQQVGRARCLLYTSDAADDM
eukprot:13095315-Alexandrium_andersonii.AAC.1